MSEKVTEKKKRASGLKRILQNSFFGSGSSKDKKRHENSRLDGSKSKAKIVPGSCDAYNFNRNLMERHTIGSNERNFYQNQHQNVMYVNQHVMRPPMSSSPLQQLPNMYFEQMNPTNIFDDKNCQHYSKADNVYDLQRAVKKENGPIRVNDMYGTVFDNLSSMSEQHELQQVQTSLKNGPDYGLVNSNRNMNFVRNSPERISIGPVGTYQNIVYQNQYFDMYENLQKNHNKAILPLTGSNVNSDRKNTTVDRRRFQRSHSFSSNESSSVDDETYRNYLIRKRNSARKRVVINNKYCDMYGQIHDTGNAENGNSNILVNDENFISGNNKKIEDDYGQIKKVGVIYGQINFKNVKNEPQFIENDDDDTSLRSNESSVAITVNDKTKDEVDNANVLEIDKICDHDWKNDKTDQHVQTKVINTENNDSKNNRQRNVNNRRDEPRRHTLTGTGLQSHQNTTIIRTMDFESMRMRNGYLMPNNSAMFDDDPGIMSEVETSSTGFRRGNKQRSSLPVVRTPNKTLERPLGLVFLQYRNETKRALLPNEITSIDTVRALFVRSFPKQLTMEYLDSAMVKIYMHDSSKDMFFELEDSRIHLRDIKDRSVLRIFEANDVTGGLPRPGIGIAATLPHTDDPSYFSEPEFDSEFQHQHIHKSKIGMGKSMPPYYIGSSKTLPRNSTLFRTYSTNNTVKNQPNQSDGYMSSPERNPRNLYEDPYYSHYANRTNTMTQVIDEEASDTEIVDESYALYGVKIGPGTTVTGTTTATSVNTRNGPMSRTLFPKVPYDSTRIKVEQMERQLANLTGLVQKALTQPQNLNTSRDNFRDELDMNSNSSSTSAQDEMYVNTNENRNSSKMKNICHKSVSFEKSVSFSDEPPDEKSQKQHSPQHFMDTKPTKSAIKSSTLPRMSSQDKDNRVLSVPIQKPLTYTSNHIIGSYRELQITPEIYNQLRCLQKKTKDIRYEMRNLRRLAQTQSHSIHEHIRDAFTKIRAMLLVRGDAIFRSEMDQEKLRLNREEDMYKQEIQHLEKDLSDLELTVEELRTNVINRKTRVNMFDVENMALVLTRSSKTIAELKLRFPMLHDGIKMLLNCEMERIVHEEKFLKDEPDRLESALRRCKKLTGTLVTLKRLASVQEQRLPCQNNLLNDHMHLDNGPGHSPINHNNNKEYATNDNLGQIDENKEDGKQQQSIGDNTQIGRQENALDALLDELQTFSKPNDNNNNNNHKIPEKSSGLVAEIGKKFDSTSGMINSDNNNNDTSSVQVIKRVPPPPPPRTSSRSPIQSPTDDKKSMAETVIKDVDQSTLSQFEAAKQNLGLTTLKRGLVTKKAQTLPRNLTDVTTISRPSIDNLETKHQELLKRQKVLQDKYLKLQKTGSESNILQKVGLQFATGNNQTIKGNSNQNKVYETDIL